MKKYDDLHVYLKETDEIAEDAYFRVIKIRAISKTFAFVRNGFAHAVYQQAGMHRLDTIHQYGWFNGNPDHTRMTHMLICYGFAQTIGGYLDLTPEEKKLLNFSALTHDVTTPSLGDRVKHLALQEFDEEHTYQDWLKSREVRAILARISLKAEDCVNTIKGKGKIGMLLDWIDKIAYTYKDLEFFEESHPLVYQRIHRRLGEYTNKFEKTSLSKLPITELRKRGHRLHLKLTVDHTGSTACTDVTVFVCFAILRAALLEEVCFNARSSGIADWYARVVIPYLINQRLLTIKNLRTNDDPTTRGVINRFFETEWVVTERDCTINEWWFDNQRDTERKVNQEMEKMGVTAFLIKSHDYGKTCVSMVNRLGVYVNGHTDLLRENELRLPFIRKAEQYGIVRKFQVISIENLPYNTKRIEELKRFQRK